MTAISLTSVNQFISIEQLDEIATEYITDFKAGNAKETGWPRLTYGLSKLLLNGLTRVYSYANL